MYESAIDITLRITLIVALWMLIWRSIKPKTQRLRILRAVLLLLCLTAVLAMLKIAGH